MIKSMTGFASLTDDDEAATITVTVRSVNHRFLDLQLRLPPTLAAIEPRLRAIVQQRVARGRRRGDGCRAAAPGTRARGGVERALSAGARRRAGAGARTGLHRRRDDARRSAALSPGAVDQGPAGGGGGVGRADARTAARVEQAVAAALDDLDEMRTREGGFLRTELDARRQQLGELFEQVSRSADQALDALRVRLSERVKELRADGLADETTVAQEIARFAGRSDITEEVVRFRGHLEHWRALSDSPEPCGRKLDFLLQEMNREVNTTGSKAEGPAVSELIVTLKAELEKMREQVQNVE
jgi:uncharacterized protein YicC (UPF0701 family)